MRGYRAALAHLAPDFLALELDQVTSLDWEEQIWTIAETYPRQAQLAHAALRKAWNDGVRKRLISADNLPYLDTELPRYRSKRIPYLLPEEIPAYSREAQKQPAALPLMLMLLLGLRRGEALGLTWDDIDQRSMVVHVRQQLYNGHLVPLKSITSARDIPVSEAVIGKIYSWGQKQREVIGKSYKSIDGNNNLCYTGGVKALYKSHAAAMEAAGIDAGVTLHGLRHTLATAALADGADVKTLQCILGHAHYKTTADLYCHGLAAKERAAIEAVGTRLEIA